MEDAHTCLLELSEDKEASFFAVFDGHGGHDVAKVASSNLHKTIANNKSYREYLICVITSVQILRTQYRLLLLQCSCFLLKNIV